MHLFSSPRRAATTVATNLGMDVANPSKEEESNSPDGKQENGGESSRGVEKGGENVSITIPEGKKAVKEERASKANSDGRDTIKEDEGEWATNLFYAYARRTDDAKASRYILTFSSAQICSEWWTLVKSEYGGAPSNTRESAQLFAFHSDDLPGGLWRNQKLEHLKSKWFFSQLGGAHGTGVRGQEVIPLQDERGWVVGPSPKMPAKSPAVSPDTAEERWKERRKSKRDSGIMFFSPHLSNFGERRDSSYSLEQPEQPKPKFDFERMERNLDKVEKLMEQNARQMQSLEHVQAANMERLTNALVHNAEMVRVLTEGQAKLGDIVEELLKDTETKGEQVKVSVREGTKFASLEARQTHGFRRPPKKIGKTIVGYVYADDARDGSKRSQRIEGRFPGTH